MTLPADGAILRNRGPGPVAIDLRRYATSQAPVELGKLGPGEAAVLAIPTDRSQVPWQLPVPADARLDVCGPP